MKGFKTLIKDISAVHNQLQQQSASAVNQALTIRNWFIGFYIIEYEQNGNDRAEYGEKLIPNIAKALKDIKGIDIRALHNFKLLYTSYPQVKEYLLLKSNMGSLTTQLHNTEFETDNHKIKDEFSNRINGELLIKKLSYSHIEQLIKIDDKLKRTFYEIECVKSTWSVRELKRQISSLYFERSGLTINTEKFSEFANKNVVPMKAIDIIKNIYSFEFLDLNVQGVIEESDLETALLDHLQEFIIELGNGFCFEKRQKRILIGENYYFLDLLFYHRILKCHVIIELKIGEFNHGDIGQLNTYLNFFKEEISEKDDQPPVGILLVTNKDNSLVKYATAGIDENLFVQQYLVKLPSKEQLEEYINEELKKM
ncbi:DUF1016 family protein [Brumimicrobium glaciale]|uniref:DUF1016 family protein n=1 Tax=Brumimicrobium glaciale TaxID=200475 RepID=A0A4Q4KG75_9FLAO|nr:PDDEXK nuclease domain-containing protein [Brumimicrobium glaciale]RYM32112.1 DUF1016 family protein [Brumimicrobium glaciale]